MLRSVPSRRFLAVGFGGFLPCAPVSPPVAAGEWVFPGLPGGPSSSRPNCNLCECHSQAAGRNARQGPESPKHGVIRVLATTAPSPPRRQSIGQQLSSLFHSLAGRTFAHPKYAVR